MARMNWGKRFRSGAVSVGARYDDFLHRSMLPPKRMMAPTRLQELYAVAKMHAKMAHKKKWVGMPKFSFDDPEPKCPREAAEDRMIARIADAVKMIEYGLTELTAIPNPSTTFKNRVNQRMLLEVVQRLRTTVNPPIPNGEERPARRVGMPLNDMTLCTTCCGPARMRYRGESYCEDCYPNDPLARASRARSERDEAIRNMEREANRMRDDIKELDQHISEANDGDDTEGHG